MSKKLWPDLSIDIETLDNKVTSAILSIGAVPFDRVTGNVAAQTKFYLEVDINSAMSVGTVSASTLCWWMTQAPSAKVIFSTDVEVQRQKAPISTVLYGFSNFIRENCAPDFRPWGNGSVFDVGVIEHNYNMCVGQAIPWKYQRVRDMRTLVDLAEELAEFDRQKVLFTGVPHNAADDAAYQAYVIAAAYRALAGQPAEKPATKPTKTVSVAAIDDDEEF